MVGDHFEGLHILAVSLSAGEPADAGDRVGIEVGFEDIVESLRDHRGPLQSPAEIDVLLGQRFEALIGADKFDKHAVADLDIAAAIAVNMAGPVFPSGIFMLF